MEKTTATTPYDVAKHLRTPDEISAYLEACREEAGDDSEFIDKALEDIAVALERIREAREHPDVIKLFNAVTIPALSSYENIWRS